MPFTSGKQKTAVGSTCASKSYMHCQPLRVAIAETTVCIVCLDWDQLGGLYGLFWGLPSERGAAFPSFLLHNLHVLSSSWFLQVLHSDVWFSTWWWFSTSRCDDNVPVLLLLVMTIANLFLCFPCSLGNLTLLPKLERFAIILARSRKLFRKTFLLLAFWKMIGFFLRPLLPSAEGLVAPTSRRPR